MRTGRSLFSAARASALLVAIAVSAIACVSTTSLMNSWIGKSESELLSSWGAPDTSRKMDDGRVIHTWKSLWGKRNNVRTCRKTFTISTAGKVEGAAYNGCAKWKPKL